MDKKFYKMSRQERLDTLKPSAESRQIFENMALNPEVANNLTENQISEFEIPLAVCFIKVDGKDFTVPMATEEPSVIAAANNGAKLADNFSILKNDRLMSGQIVFHDVQDSQALSTTIVAQRKQIFELALTSYPSIYKRGGGLIDYTCHSYEDWLSVDFSFDTRDAMGANMINTMLEAIANYFRGIFPNEKILFAILTNENCQCTTTVECRIPIEKIGLEVAKNIVKASDYAQVDSARAATHNKGILNGVEAVVLATGNDSRGAVAAIYAGADPHKGFSQWRVNNDNSELIGEITLSLPIATAGGATHVLPKAIAAHELLKNPDAKQLAAIIASIGLANNLAALKALVTKGIQAGHMSLQARSLALSVGARGQEIDQLTEALKKADHLNAETARKLLEAIKNPSVS
ncbi:MAG: hydroxymethylglutaryl-CoA reductase [Streptococcaceae bacterium]|nr:hydroxymethylglutaryl-CoA reductase [Streptococcaceae bacterium]